MKRVHRIGRWLAPVVLCVFLLPLYSFVPGCDLYEEVNVSEISNPARRAFEGRLTYSTGELPYRVLTGDINRDTLNDIITLDWQGETASVMLANGDGYAAAVTYSIGATPRDGVLADLDADGLMDIAVANESLDCITILFGNGDGTFSEAAGMALPAGSLPGEILDVDLDGDGIVDLLTSNGGANSLSLLKGEGEGVFSEPQGISLAFQPSGLWAGQLLEDGPAEIMVVDSAANNLHLLRFTGVQYEEQAVLPCGLGPRTLIAIDLNLDTHLDFLVSNLKSNDLSILFGQGNGQFSAETRLSFPSPVSRIAAGDFTGDTVPDIAVLLFDKIGEDRRSAGVFCTVQGDGANGFKDLAIYGAGWGAVSLSLADMNGDGAADICTADLARNTVSLAYNRGDGSFESERRYNLGDRPKAAVLADFNGDGATDVAVLNRGDNTISVMGNDGKGGFKSLSTVTFTALPLALAAGDLNGDGKQDLVVAMTQQYAVRVLSGVGNGIFLPPGVFNLFAESQGPLPEVQSIALGDVNNDSYLDIVTGNSKRDSVSALLNDGDGRFGTPVVTQVDNFPLDVHLEDVNRDGNLDLLFVSTNDPDVATDEAEPRVVRWFGGGDGTFDESTHMRISTGGGPRAMEVGDLTGEGRPDVVTVHTAGNNLYLLQGVSNTNFSAGSKLFIGEDPVAVKLVDINTDGKRDLVCGLNVGSVIMRFSRGDMTFENPNNFIIQPGLSNVLVTDLDQDRYPDLIAINTTNDYMAVMKGGAF